MPEGQNVTAEVLSASIGGMFSASALYPLEVLKTKIQAADSKKSEDPDDEKKNGEKNDDEKKIDPPPSTDMIVLAKQMYEENGISAFYNGVGTSAFQSATEKALYFFAYTSLKNAYTSIVTSTKDIGTLANLSRYIRSDNFMAFLVTFFLFMIHELICTDVYFVQQIYDSMQNKKHLVVLPSGLTFL